MRAFTTDKTKSKPWPNRWTIKLIVANFEGTANEAHVQLFRTMSHEKMTTIHYAELGEPLALDEYEISQVADTFTTEEAETIKRYFDRDPDVTLEISPAYFPVPGASGILPFFDLYCGILNFSKILPALTGTITHFVTPENMILEYDESFATFTFDPTTSTGYQVQTDKGRATKELEQRRQATRHKLKDMLLTTI